MPITRNIFGSTTIAKVDNSDELRQVLIDPWLDSETIIVKPNWVSTSLGLVAKVIAVYHSLLVTILLTMAYLITLLD